MKPIPSKKPLFKPKPKQPEVAPSQSTAEADMIPGATQSLPFSKLSPDQQVVALGNALHELHQLHNQVVNRIQTLEDQMRLHSHEQAGVKMPLSYGH